MVSVQSGTNQAKCTSARSGSIELGLTTSRVVFLRTCCCAVQAVAAVAENSTGVQEAAEGESGGV